MASKPPHQGYYDWNTQENMATGGAYSYDFGTPEFGTQPQFGQFDYDSSHSGKMPNVPAQYPASNQGVYYPSPPSYSGSILTPDTSTPFDGGPENFEDEPPLLEELGINFDHIWQKNHRGFKPVQRS